MTGVWVYNWIEKRYQWVINGKAYTSPAAVPAPQTKRPCYDPGQKVVKR